MQMASNLTAKTQDLTSAIPERTLGSEKPNLCQVRPISKSTKPFSFCHTLHPIFTLNPISGLSVVPPPFIPGLLYSSYVSSPPSLLIFQNCASTVKAFWTLKIWFELMKGIWFRALLGPIDLGLKTGPLCPIIQGLSKRFEHLLWPPRSPDLTPCDFFPMGIR